MGTCCSSTVPPTHARVSAAPTSLDATLGAGKVERVDTTGASHYDGTSNLSRNPSRSPVHNCDTGIEDGVDLTSSSTALLVALDQAKGQLYGAFSLAPIAALLSRASSRRRQRPRDRSWRWHEHCMLAWL